MLYKYQPVSQLSKISYKCFIKEEV
jgi:hypothetical protein